MRLIYGLCLAVFVACSADTECTDPDSLNFGTSEACIYADTGQYALYFKFTGTWCPPCGSSGAVRMKKTLASDPYIIGIEVHHQDEMTSAVGNKFISHFGINLFPSFRINNDERSLSDALSRKADLGLHVTYKQSDEKLSVTVHLKALEDLPSSQYHIAVYLLEDDRIAPQYATDHSAYPEWKYENGRYPEYKHTNILKDEAMGMTFGTLFHKGPIANGESFSHYTELAFTETHGELYPLVVIWKKEQGTYSFVNARKG